MPMFIKLIIPTNSNIHSRRYLYDIINSPDDDLSARDQKEMQDLRNKNSNLALLTIHATFCSEPLEYMTCIPCNLVKDNTQ